MRQVQAGPARVTQLGNYRMRYKQILGALDVRSLASALLVCSSWRRQAATCPQLYRAAFKQRFDSGSQSGWWPLHRLLEALERQLDAQAFYKGMLKDLQQEMAVCKRSLAKSQATYAGLAALLASAEGKAAPIEARLEEAATRDEVLQGKPRGLRPEDAELLNRAVQKFALPELRRRAAVKYFFG